MLNRSSYNFIVKYGEVSPDGVAVYDLNSRSFVYLNRFLSDIFEGQEAPLLSDADAVKKLVVPEDLDYVEYRYRELLSIGCIPPVEFRIQAGGHLKYLLAEVLWLEESYTFAIFVRDISAQRIHEYQMLESGIQKDSLLEMLIHQLGSNLKMAADAQRLLGNAPGPFPPELKNLLELIGTNTGFCIKSIGDLVQRHQELAVKTPFVRSRFDAVRQVQLAVKVAGQLDRRKQIELRTPASQLWVHQDAHKFMQVLQCLLSNSVKFTDDDGTIGIDLALTGETLSVSVTDNGKGVPEAVRKKLFAAPVPGEKGNHGEESRGWSLFLASRLTEQMKGEISLDTSEPGKTVMRLDLPVV